MSATVFYFRPFPDSIPPAQSYNSVTQTRRDKKLQPRGPRPPKKPPVPIIFSTTVLLICTVSFLKFRDTLPSKWATVQLWLEQQGQEQSVSVPETAASTETQIPANDTLPPEDPSLELSDAELEKLLTQIERGLHARNSEFNSFRNPYDLGQSRSPVPPITFDLASAIATPVNGKYPTVSHIPPGNHHPGSWKTSMPHSNCYELNFPKQ